MQLPINQVQAQNQNKKYKKGMQKSRKAKLDLTVSLVVQTRPKIMMCVPIVDSPMGIQMIHYLRMSGLNVLVVQSGAIFHAEQLAK